MYMYIARSAKQLLLNESASAMWLSSLDFQVSTFSGSSKTSCHVGRFNAFKTYYSNLIISPGRGKNKKASTQKMSSTPVSNVKIPNERQYP